MAIATETIWKSKNELWEVILEGNDLFLYSKKNQAKYSTTINKNEMVWMVSINTSAEIPAYVNREITKSYLKFYREGDIM